MNDLPRLAGRIFNRPLLVEPTALDAMLAPLRARLGVEGAAPSIDLRVEAPVQLQAMDQSDEEEARRRRARRPYAVTGTGAAVIPVLGALVSRAGQITADCTELRSYAALEREVAMALRDDDVRGIVLDIDSPGGEAANVMEFAQRLAAARGTKRIVALVNPGAYSAAYAIASAADRIVLPPSAGVGSVGVVALHVDRSAADEKAGHRYTWIAAGARKLDGNPHAPLSEGAQAAIGAEVERLYGLFIDTVARNRAQAGLAAAAVRGSEAGLFFGENAVAARFADELGGLAEAIALATAGTQTGRGRPSARRHPTGAKMDGNDLAGSESAQNNQGGGQASALDADAIRAQADAAAAARARGIAALCQLAGVPARAAAFISDGKTEAQVRDELITLQANAGGEGGEIAPTRPAGAGVLGALPEAGGAMSPGAVKSAWDRVGAAAFGNKWKGF